MAATVIDGREIARLVREDVRAEVDDLVGETGVRPGLATVLVGDDPGSAVYVAGKHKACEEAGIVSIHHPLPAATSQDELAELLAALNADPAVSGTLLQLPVPAHLDGSALTALIHPDKDVDGLTPISAGRLARGVPGLRPCTPSGVIELVDRHGVELAGAEAVVVGRSDLVGKPLAALLLARNATVTVCHSRTRDLAEHCRRADVLCAAVGIPRFVRGDWVKPDATVIDVGINRLEEGLVGDVDFEGARERARLITPVPGGVGPMTIAMLLRNTVSAARARERAPTAA